MPTSRGPLRGRHIAEALRALTNEHAKEREPFDKRRAWQRIERSAGRASASAWDANRWRLSLLAVAITTLALAGHFYRKATLPLRYQASGITSLGGNLSTDSAFGELEFSDQSHISASPHSAFNVDIVGRHAALTRLARGKLHVRVHHEPDTNWRFYAGRYEVQVVGTEFDLAWDDETERLTLQMESGEVRVLGAPGAARVVRAGGVLRLPEASAPADSATAAAPPASGAIATAVTKSTANATQPAS
jgi:ferric-dicitrate binding protein FerR (iron transport regulator)